VCLPLDPRFASSNLVEGDGFLKAIKSRSSPSFEVKPDAPSRKILLHVKELLKVSSVQVPAALYSRGKDPRYPLDRRLGRPQPKTFRQPIFNAIPCSLTALYRSSTNKAKHVRFHSRTLWTAT